jgi:hypothetical protein
MFGWGIEIMGKENESPSARALGDSRRIYGGKLARMAVERS